MVEIYDDEVNDSDYEEKGLKKQMMIMTFVKFMMRMNN